MSALHHGSDHEDLLQEKLSAILRICREMNSQRDLEALLDLVATDATTLLEADRASIFLLDRDPEDPAKVELWSKIALGSTEILRFDARKGIAGAVASSGETINVRDAYADPRFLSRIDDQTGYHTRTLLAVPLQNLHGEIIGVFEVLNKKAGSFTAADEEVLKSLAAQAAIAIQTAQFIATLEQSRERLVEENLTLRREVEGRPPSRFILGSSDPIQAVLRRIERIRDSSVNVLINGESGTGKELAARAIHFSSPRAGKPYVALNCAALPENLVESELFGIEKGVATGVLPRKGQFETASGGTLFLDEIGDLSLPAQAKILRALQEQVIERVGGRGQIRVDVRVVAATNKDLEEEIRAGRFREDLYYRLRVIHLRMPSLREIRDDIPQLAQHFLREYSREQKRAGLEYAPALIRAMQDYTWPGNVRQMQNEVRRMVVCASGPQITEEDFWEGIPKARAAAAPATAPAHDGELLKDAVDRLEEQMIREALAASGNNQQRAAKALGLSRQGLINKMKRFGL